MIRLRGIKKNYRIGNNTINALKGIDITFRNNEFVAILGPSGGGKTTLLNIVGGLDHCSSGDLIINGKSTSDFKDKDWDSYRNHSVGFVFQSYNLIPHQTVLANVELALTISGISQKERKIRAKQALISVGLEDQFDKKPNQLSGGQMQRVAIARAIVNNPDILLADEPTGALDSDTSVQIMEIIKEIAKDRLVVMVTHNPDLAEQYATRIVKIKDGLIVSDSNVFNDEIESKDFTVGKTIMNFITALSLSFNNLLTKKTRTILTAFAGSIGIIGIALILALSTGINNYIAEVQTNSLSSYPLTIENKTADFSTALMAMMGEIHNETDKEEGALKEVQVISKMFGSVETNDLKGFNDYMEDNKELFEPLLTSVQYKYGTTLQIYKADTSNGIVQLNPSTLFSNSSSSKMFSSYSYSNAFSEMIDNRELLEKQYDVLCGKWPNNYNECIIVIDSKDTVTDYFLYNLGIKDNSKLQEILKKISKGETVEESDDSLKITYDELVELTFKVVNPSDCYKYNETYKIWEDMREDKQYMISVLNKSLDLNVVGVVTAKEGVSSTALGSGVAYTSELTKYMIKEASKSQLVIKTLEDAEVDVFTNNTFEELNDSEKGSGLDFSSMITVDQNAIASAFGMNISEREIADIVNQYMSDAMNIEVNTIDLDNDLNASLAIYFNEMLINYIDECGTAGMAMFDTNDIASVISNFETKQKCIDLFANLQEKYGIQSAILKQFMDTLCTSVLANYYEMMKNVNMLQQDKAILNETIINNLSAALATEEIKSAVRQFAEQMVSGKIQMNVGASMSGLSSALISKMASSMSVDANILSSAFKFTIDEDEITRLMNAFMTSDTSERSQQGNLQKLGYGDFENPTSISFYFKDFECKERFKALVDEYNESVSSIGNEKAISYSDLTGILMSSITSIIDAISYVLIAFVSVSLIVSSIMIAIITYISVLERTKEIGILRSLGASKEDVRNVFNAETFIIGLLSGTIGVVSTVLLCFPISDIVRKLTGISTITASLPEKDAIILIIISVGLTIIAGLIPSNMASKCDPVIALRNE